MIKSPPFACQRGLFARVCALLWDLRVERDPSKVWYLVRFHIFI